MQMSVKLTIANSQSYTRWVAVDKWACTVRHTLEVISSDDAARMSPQQMGLLWQVCTLTQQMP